MSEPSIGEKKQGSRSSGFVGSLSWIEVRYRRERGDTLHQIAADAGVSRERIWQVCQKLGVDPRDAVQTRTAAAHLKRRLEAWTDSARLAAFLAQKAGGVVIPNRARGFLVNGKRYVVHLLKSAGSTNQRSNTKYFRFRPHIDDCDCDYTVILLPTAVLIVPIEDLPQCRMVYIPETLTPYFTNSIDWRNYVDAWPWRILHARHKKR